MKLTALVILAAGLMMGQIKPSEKANLLDFTTTSAYNLSDSSSFTNVYSSGFTWASVDGCRLAVSLMTTRGGGMKIQEGCGSGRVIAEILPDGTITGDRVRALRMLAAALAVSNPMAAKGEEPKEP